MQLMPPPVLLPVGPWTVKDNCVYDGTGKLIIIVCADKHPDDLALWLSRLPDVNLDPLTRAPEEREDCPRRKVQQ